MRFSDALDRPLDTLITSSATVGDTPAFVSVANPSAADQMWIASRALFTALSACPAPTGPQCTIRSPNASSTSNAGGSNSGKALKKVPPVFVSVIRPTRGAPVGSCSEAPVGVVRSAVLSAAFLTVALVLGEFTIASLLNRTNLQVAINFLGKSDAKTSVAASLASLASVDAERPVAVARELTKLHEEIVRGESRFGH